ncbi:MAG: nitrite reductase small subunit NirD [Candidatus Omnitrophica bacterium]|nr:nitrite reductase small subunit NirD [Candidatus Omnitrophota bacterium]
MNDTSQTETRWYEAVPEGAIPVREGRRVIFKDHQIALFNLGDRFIAVDNRCPHRQGPLADGIIAGHAVFCPLHNWKIGLENGCVLAGGEGKVKVYPTKIANHRVYVAFDSGDVHKGDTLPLQSNVNFKEMLEGDSA